MRENARVSESKSISPSRRWSLRAKRIGTVVLLGGAGISAAACGAEAAADPVDADGIPVIVRSVGHLGRANYLSLSGDVEGLRTASVGFQVPGVVSSVGPSEGQAVEEGQVIASLDSVDYALNMEIADAQLERAQDEYDRAKQMFAERGIPENDFHKAGTGLRLAKAQAAMARKKLGDTRIVSPMSGVVARRGIEPGEQAGPGFPVFTIVQVNPIQVRIGVPESQIGEVAVGQTARIVVPSLKGRTFVGKLRVVGIAADPAARTFTAKAEVANPQGVLRPGMIAEVQVEGARRVDALTVPAEAVVRNASGVMQVFVFDSTDKRVYAKRVDVGAAYGQEVEIRSGLTATDLVVVGGQHRVREGSRVVARIDALPSAAAGAKSPR